MSEGVGSSHIRRAISAVSTSLHAMPPGRLVPSGGSITVPSLPISPLVPSGLRVRIRSIRRVPPAGIACVMIDDEGKLLATGYEYSYSRYCTSSATGTVQ